MKDPTPVATNVNKHWSWDQHVQDISFPFFYTPHYVVALLVVLVGLLSAFFIDAEALSFFSNARTGVLMAVLAFLIFGLTILPSGPFIRPHPIIWKATFALGILYEMFLIFMLFQSRDDARKMMAFFDQDLNVPLDHVNYATDCTLNWENVKDKVFDVYVIAHSVGWVTTYFIIRDVMIATYLSVAWEFVELLFLHMLPNFEECWWDQWLLDVSICNASGIFVGWWLSRRMQMHEYRWSKYQDLPSVWSKGKRLVSQFTTPASWEKLEWQPLQSVKRFLAIHGIIFCFLLSMLNSFFLKHILWIPSENIINSIRVAILTFLGVPATRQAYIYYSDPTCKALGSYAWLQLCVIMTEVYIILKFSTGLYPQSMDPVVKTRFIWGAAIYVVVAVLLLVHTRRKKKKALKQKEAMKKKE